MGLPIFSGKTGKELCVVLVESTVKLQGQWSEEGKKTIEDNKNTLGPERVKEFKEPANWLMALRYKLSPPEDPDTGDMKNNLGPK